MHKKEKNVILKLSFTKMQACGNDYIYVDCTSNQYEKKLDFSKLSKSLSRRRFSVGADGIILICRSDVADARMLMYNADSSEGSMCGNGIRCTAKYMYEIMGIKKNVLEIETKSGVKKIEILSDPANCDVAREIIVDMGRPSFVPESILVDLNKLSLARGEWNDASLKGGNGFDARSERGGVNNKKTVNLNKYSLNYMERLCEILNFPVHMEGREYCLNCVSMGNPHCVLICENGVEKIDLESVASDFYVSGIFPSGVNIEIVNIDNDKSITARVWERGSRETFACGTGASACFAILKKLNLIDGVVPLYVRLKGGTLVVFGSDNSEEIFLSGPAEFVYSGVLSI